MTDGDVEILWMVEGVGGFVGGWEREWDGIREWD